MRITRSPVPAIRDRPTILIRPNHPHPIKPSAVTQTIRARSLAANQPPALTRPKPADSLRPAVSTWPSASGRSQPLDRLHPPNHLRPPDLSHPADLLRG